MVTVVTVYMSKVQSGDKHGPLELTVSVWPTWSDICIIIINIIITIFFYYWPVSSVFVVFFLATVQYMWSIWNYFWGIFLPSFNSHNRFLFFYYCVGVSVLTFSYC